MKIDKQQMFTLEQLQYLHRKWKSFDDEDCSSFSHDVSSFLMFVADSEQIIKKQEYQDYPDGAKNCVCQRDPNGKGPLL